MGPAAPADALPVPWHHPDHPLWDRAAMARTTPASPARQRVRLGWQRGCRGLGQRRCGGCSEPGRACCDPAAPLTPMDSSASATGNHSPHTLLVERHRLSSACPLRVAGCSRTCKTRLESLELAGDVTPGNLAGLQLNRKPGLRVRKRRV